MEEIKTQEIKTQELEVEGKIYLVTKRFARWDFNRRILSESDTEVNYTPCKIKEQKKEQT